MQELKFYKTLPSMECLQGSTLEPFTVVPVNTAADGTETGMSIAGCTMQLIVAPMSTPTEAAIVKDCTAVDGGFEVQLTHKDTAKLSGDYALHFALTDADGLVYRNLCGMLWVHPTAQGGAV